MAHNQWTEMALGDFVTLQRGHDLPEHSRKPGSIPVLGSFGITGYHSEPRSQGPGVTVGRSGASFGVVSFCQENFWPLNTALYVVDFHGNCQRFAYYLIKSIDFTRFNSGSAQPSLNRNFIHPIPIKVPPYDDQVAIASFLGAIEDKIELNRRINETLEAIARAIFKSWFIDFDPVRAKAQGSQPAGMSSDIAELFPSRFDESPLGMVPAGWTPSTLGAAAKTCGGGIQTGPFGSQLHASDYVPEGIPVVMPQDIDIRRVCTANIARVRETDAERLGRHRLHAGDIVYSRRGNVELHALIGLREEGWLCGTGCLLVRLGPRWKSPKFVSLALDRPESRAWISQHAVGATMPNLNTGILSAVPLLVPADSILEAFNDVVDPLERRIVANDAESETLLALRDTLLPKLISGEIRLADAEKQIEAHA
jgi:type I restriction enzyme S subunit